MESPVSTMFSAMMPFIVCMSSTSACTPLSERPSCGQGYADCVPICDYSSIAPLVQEFCPAQLKLTVRAGITGTASRVKRRYKGLSNFAAVRTSSRAVWQSAGITAVMFGNRGKYTNILYALVVGAVVCRRGAAVRAGDSHVRVRIAYFPAYYFHHAHTSERRMRNRKWDLAAGAQSGRHPVGVLLISSPNPSRAAFLPVSLICRPSFGAKLCHGPLVLLHVGRHSVPAQRVFALFLVYQAKGIGNALELSCRRSLHGLPTPFKIASPFIPLSTPWHGRARRRTPPS